MQCGNELLCYEECAVCAAGRGRGVVVARPHQVGRPKAKISHCRCPYCESALGTEDWEGNRVLSCRECHGTFFPDHTLESVLNQLRASCEVLEVSAVLEDFRERFQRKLPPSVRYRHCPVCEGPMKRHNYGRQSGVIVHVCGDHGTFVGETEMAGLADFIVRGGDHLTERATKIHISLTGRNEQRPRSVMDHMFGSRG